MMKTLAISTLLAISACGTPELDLDDQAAAAEDAGKADGVSLVRLERATATEAAVSFTEVRGTELTECFAGYRARFDANATVLTKAVTEKFIDVAIQSDHECAEWFDLGVIVKGVLDAKGVTQATPAAVITAIPAWAKPQLEAASVGGFVSMRKASLLFYSDLNRVQDANAMTRENNPTGVDLAAIRAAWEDVRDETTLDRAYLNPVTFPAGALDGDQVFKNLRAAFPLRSLKLQATGLDAISEFAAADEGPSGDPAFAPIAKALRKSSIRKRFYYASDAADWSSNVLIVVDQHGQAYGMQMGYTE